MGRSAIHPGEHLAEQLEELAMSAASWPVSSMCQQTALLKS